MSALLGTVRWFDQNRRHIWASEESDMPSQRAIALLFFLIAIPDGYAFGAVPAMLAALLYCALLTAYSRLLRPLIRACVAAICGGLASWVWFCESLGASGIYGLVGALVMAALSISAPRPGAKQLMVKE